MNAYLVTLKYTDAIDTDVFEYTVFGRNEDDAIFAAKDELNREINGGGYWYDEDIAFAEIVSVEMIDPMTIL